MAHSREKEGNNSVLNVFFSELEMVTNNRDKLDLASLVEGLDTELVVLVEIGVFEGHQIAILVELLEPLGLLGVDHGVFGEHHEECTVEGGEALLAGWVISVVRLLVVKVRQEDRALKILVKVVGVSEVSSRSKEVLHPGVIDEVTGNAVDHVADKTVEAVGDIDDTEVGATDGGPVADLALDGAALSDVTSEKGSLGKSHHVDLIDGELGVGQEGLAGLVGLIHEVVLDGGDGAIAYLEALGVVASLLLDFLGEVVHAGVDAGVAKTVENGGGDSGD